MNPLYSPFSRIKEHIPTTRKQICINLKRNSLAVFNAVSATFLGLAGLALVGICDIPTNSPSSSTLSTTTISPTNQNTPPFLEKVCLLAGFTLTLIGSSLMVVSVIQSVRALRIILPKVPRSSKRLRKRFKLIYNIALETCGGILGLGSTLASYACYMRIYNLHFSCTPSNILSIISGVTSMLQGAILIIIICKKHDGLCVKGTVLKVDVCVYEENGLVALRMREPDLLTFSELRSIQEAP